MPKKMSMITCDEGHGRIVYLGHVCCAGCGRVFRKQPETQCACGSGTFERCCPKCFQSAVKSEAQTSLVDIGFGGEGHAGLEEV